MIRKRIEKRRLKNLKQYGTVTEQVSEKNQYYTRIAIDTENFKTHSIYFTGGSRTKINRFNCIKDLHKKFFSYISKVQESQKEVSINMNDVSGIIQKIPEIAKLLQLFSRRGTLSDEKRKEIIHDWLTTINKTVMPVIKNAYNASNLAVLDVPKIREEILEKFKKEFGDKYSD